MIAMDLLRDPQGHFQGERSPCAKSPQTGPFGNIIRKHLRSDTVKPNFKIPDQPANSMASNPKPASPTLLKDCRDGLMPRI